MIFFDPSILDGYKKPFPMDAYNTSNLKLCLSPLKRMLTTYTSGKAMKLRRVSDNVETTFYYKRHTGRVDYAEITSFKGASDLRLVSVWDQKNNVEWTQTSAGVQLLWDDTYKCFTRNTSGSDGYIANQAAYTANYFLYRIQGGGCTEFHHFFPSGANFLICAQNGELISVSSSNLRYRIINNTNTAYLVDYNFAPDLVTKPINKYHWKHGTSQTNDFKMYENNVLKVNSDYINTLFKTSIGAMQIRFGTTSADAGNCRIRDWISFDTILSDADCTAILNLQDY